MNMIAMLALITTGTTLLAFFWLSARAFRHGVPWGIGVLLLSPVVGTAFGIRYWRDEKRPFLVYLGALLSTTGLAVWLFSAWGGWELLAATRNVEQALQTRTLTPEDAGALTRASLSFASKSGYWYENRPLAARMRHQLVQDAGEMDRAERREKQIAEPERYDLKSLLYEESAKKERYRLVYLPIEVKDAGRYVGSTVKLTRKGVREREYRLVGVTANSLQLLQSPSGGTYTFSLKHRDIEKLRVLTRQDY